MTVALTVLAGLACWATVAACIIITGFRIGLRSGLDSAFVMAFVALVPAVLISTVAAITLVVWIAS